MYIRVVHIRYTYIYMFIHDTFSRMHNTGLPGLFAPSQIAFESTTNDWLFKLVHQLATFKKMGPKGGGRKEEGGEMWVEGGGGKGLMRRRWFLLPGLTTYLHLVLFMCIINLRYLVCLSTCLSVHVPNYLLPAFFFFPSALHSFFFFASNRRKNHIITLSV